MISDASYKQLTYICDQVQLCMLPALKEDLDKLQLLPAYFKGYHAVLRQELPKLFDVLQQLEDNLFNDNSYNELRAQLVLFFCELTMSPTIYKLDNEFEIRLQNANKLLIKLFANLGKVGEEYILSYYEKKLHKDCWKRQLGAAHGFVRYLEHYYADETKLSTSMLTFSLAVGLNMRECCDSDYKQLGVRIFSQLLNHGYATDIQRLNIHSVIYENVFKDAYSMDSIGATISIWNCLCSCLDHFIDLNGFEWNKCDDMLDRLIHFVTVTSNVQMSICLLSFITQLGYYFAINRTDIKIALEVDLSIPQKFKECWEVCASLNNSTTYRWAKRILQMLVLESEKLLQSTEVCAQMLAAMQCVYMVCILPIPLQALNSHLQEFYDKFVAVLLKSLVLHKKSEPIFTLTQHFVDIFAFQLKNVSQECKLPDGLKEYKPALENLQQILAKQRSAGKEVCSANDINLNKPN